MRKTCLSVHTGTGDVDVRITPTAYFIEQTGSENCPIELINTLLSLGYYFEENDRKLLLSESYGRTCS